MRGSSRAGPHCLLWSASSQVKAHRRSTTEH
uniref:Uncharacterized protein n=1 Tax=Anguilla anguilla TaxID=7936 RepID=A0A0E9W0F0_ANGAN